jgi:hypothetical protein
MFSPLDLVPDSFVQKEEEQFEDKADGRQFATGLHVLCVDVSDDQREEERECLPSDALHK